MRTILVCGGRDFYNGNLFYKTMYELIGDDEEVIIVSGGAKGADEMTANWAMETELRHREFWADWKKYGRVAGSIRNKEMLEYCLKQENAMVLAFWDGKSKGTKNMIDLAKKAGLPVKIVSYTKETAVDGVYWLGGNKVIGAKE